MEDAGLRAFHQEVNMPTTRFVGLFYTEYSFINIRSVVLINSMTRSTHRVHLPQVKSQQTPRKLNAGLGSHLSSRLVRGYLVSLQLGTSVASDS